MKPDFYSTPQKPQKIPNQKDRKFNFLAFLSKKLGNNLFLKNSK